MTDQALVTEEYHVGDGWRFECRTCHYQVGIDHRPPETCPNCGRGGWWFHCTTGDSFQKHDWTDYQLTVTKKNSRVLDHSLILSQADNSMACPGDENNGDSETSGRGRGRPALDVPLDLIKELAGRGLSSRAIAKELAVRGITGIGYRTVYRRLQGSFL